MSFFEDASLVLIPSAQKTSKVYSVKPTDGTGDLTFTRSNDTATRVGPDGLIEKVRTNLILQSQTFDNASWIKDFGASVTANTTAAPDGTTTADTLTIADTQYLFQNIVLVAGNPYTISIYVKVASGTNQFKFNTFGSSNNFTSSAFTATTTWQRFSYTFTAVGSGSTAIYPLIVDGLAGGSFFIWGAQVETTDFGATDYIATTSAAVSVGPVANVPRLDYLNSSCPRLLLEPQRTNLNPYSEQFDNADWEKTNSTITANATTSPDGYTNADAWFETTTNDWHRLYDNGISVTSGTAYTCSLFVKPNGRDWVSMEFFAGGGGFNGSRVWFNIANGTIGTTQTGITAKIENYGNGWYRISATQTAAATTTGYILYLLATGDGVVTYAGDPTKGAFVYGGMTEAGAYATSYIGPTLGAAVTRGADMSGTTNYFGAQTFAGDFTFFVDLLPMEGNTGVSDAMILGGGDYTSGGNFQSYFRFASGQIILRGVGEAFMIASNYTINANQSYKILVTRTGTTVKIFANGAQIGANATSSTTVILRSLGWSYQQATYNYDGRINKVLLMPSGLTDAQAIELTTI